MPRTFPLIAALLVLAACSAPATPRAPVDECPWPAGVAPLPPPACAPGCDRIGRRCTKTRGVGCAPTDPLCNRDPD